LVPVVAPPQRRDVHASAHGRAGCLGEALDEASQLLRRHVPVRIRAVVAKARKAALPVGAEQAQGVPAFAPPGVRDVTPLQHDMVNGQGAEEMARGRAGVARADDDRRGSLHDSALARDLLRPGELARQATSTVTFVGLVRASNTAERFWDWATRASISSFEA